MMHQQYSLLTNCTVSYISGGSTAMSSTSYRRLVDRYLSEQLSQLKSLQEYPKTRISSQSTDSDFTLTGGTIR